MYECKKREGELLSYMHAYYMYIRYVFLIHILSTYLFECCRNRGERLHVDISSYKIYILSTYKYMIRVIHSCVLCVFIKKKQIQCSVKNSLDTISTSHSIRIHICILCFALLYLCCACFSPRVESESWGERRKSCSNTYFSKNWRVIVINLRET